MVAILDPPPDEAQAASRKRGGGPRTLVGRMKSRENSVKSSLRSKVVFSKDMASRILERNWLLDAQLGPKTRYEQMLIADMALAKARIDRCAELRVENEDRVVDRTLNFWEHDQVEKALKLKKRLSRDPEGAALKLSGFKQGVDLKISLWEELSEALQINGDWDDEQRQLSLDLRGVAPIFRKGNALLRGLITPAMMAETVAREIAGLRAIKEQWLDQQDADDQDDSLIGLSVEDSPTVKKLRRYEAMSRRDYDKAFAELQRVKAEGEARCKDGYVKSTLRAWDVDALIARIKAIQDPPGLYAERPATPPPVPRVAEAPPVAPAPAPVVVDEVPPTVSPKTTPVPPAACDTSSADVAETPLKEPAPDAPVSSATSILSDPATSPEPADKAPLSRRARKVLQRRLRESARREAGRQGP